MIEAIKRAGGKPNYTEYPGVGHNSWDKAYADPALYEWLFAQRLSQRAK
jgi:predicted peptidase